MPTQVLMPQLGESVDEGTITRWLKAAGDSIEEYEPLLEINTDKVDSEIPSPAAGVLLEILVPEGTTVHAGDLLAWIGEAGEAAGQDEPPAQSGDTLPVGTPAEKRSQPAMASGTAPASVAVPPSPGRNRELGFISPVVARIAQEEHIDLYQVTGTGQGGRITKKDLLNYLEHRPPEPVPATIQAASSPVPPAPTSKPDERVEPAQEASTGQLPGQMPSQMPNAKCLGKCRSKRPSCSP